MKRRDDRWPEQSPNAEAGRYAYERVQPVLQDMGNAAQSGIYAGGSGLNNALYYGADKAGLDALAEYGATNARELAQRSQDYSNRVKDPDGVTRFIRGTMSRVPMMAPGLLASALSGGGAIPWAVASLASGGMESMANSGNVQRQLIDAGVDPAVARSSANKNLVAELPLDMLTARFGIAGKGLGASAREMVGDAVGNFFQEPGQSFLSRAARKSGGTWEGMGRELINQLGDLDRIRTAFADQGLPSALSSIVLGSLLPGGAATRNMLTSGGGDFDNEPVPAQWPKDRFASARR